MSADRHWGRHLEFWRSVPQSSYAMFLAGVFFMFLPVGLLLDVVRRGADPPPRLFAEMMFSGALAVVYVVIVERRPRWLVLLVAAHIGITMQLDRFVPLQTAPLMNEALQTRLQRDTIGVLAALIISFIFLSRFIQREGGRFIRAHTEIALARDIHRLLVPAIQRRIGRFEFRGVSIPSGDVGGDLIDVIESDESWTGYVADVSGHGVGAGLLMGMVKSAARMQLQGRQRLDELLNKLNLILFDLKKPEMFVTFAGLQCDGAELNFSVAGHLPILQYRRASGVLEELSVAQIPVAMFADRLFSACAATYSSGDLFVILTDGLIEVFDGYDREFGLERMKDLIREHAMAPLDSLLDVLLAAPRLHGPQIDDQTLLLIRVVD